MTADHSKEWERLRGERSKIPASVVGANPRKALRALRAIHSYIQEHEYSPTIREVAEAMDVESTGGGWGGGEDRPKLTRVGDPKGYPTHLEAALALVEILQVEVDEQAIAVAIAREGMGG
jgi:hypothetical protein